MKQMKAVHYAEDKECALITFEDDSVVHLGKQELISLWMFLNDITDTFPVDAEDWEIVVIQQDIKTHVIDEDKFQEAANYVEQRYKMSGLSSGLYYDYAKDVASHYLVLLNADKDFQDLSQEIVHSQDTIMKIEDNRRKAHAKSLFRSAGFSDDEFEDTWEGVEQDE